MREIALNCMHIKRPKIVCGWGSAQTLLGILRRSPRALDALIGWRGRHPQLFLGSSRRVDAFDHRSWTFVGTGRKDGHGHTRFLM